MERTQRTVLKTLSSIFFIVILSFTITKPAYAGPVSWVSKKVFGAVAQSFDIDIRRTVTDTVVSAIGELPSHLLFGRSADEMQVCSYKFTEAITGGRYGDIQEAGNNDDVITREDLDNADCTDMGLNLIAYDMGFPQPTPTADRASGGLATGLYQFVGGAVYTEEVPASLAFYSKSVAKKIPVVKDTAFAAGPYDNDSVLWSAVLNVWEISKNIAYGLLAIFMLYIGIMIMMRKETDPRTTVTIQSALPKIVIAVILITFSYAIGAFGAEAIRGLSRLAYTPADIVIDNFRTNYSGIAPVPGLLGAFSAVARLSVASSGVFGTGLLSLILFNVVLLILIFLTIMVLFKALVAYFKVILGIWTAPITFAWGAIPGNEDSTANWFKNLAVNVITVPAMKLGIATSLWISYEMLAGINPNQNIADAVGLGGANILTGLTIPIFLIVFLVWTLKIPNLLEEAILNKRGK